MSPGIREAGSNPSGSCFGQYSKFSHLLPHHRDGPGRAAPGRPQASASAAGHSATTGCVRPRLAAQAIGTPAARLAYLQRDDISSRVHLFRQRIPIRNVDPSPYQ